MTLFKVLEHIEKRSGMYFSDTITLSLLEAFILGYQSNSVNGEIVGDNGFEFDYFNSWLTGAIPATLPEEYGWKKRIEHISNSDDHSVKLFFDLIEKFSKGSIEIIHEETEPKTLKWSRGFGNDETKDFQQIEETIVKFEIIKHEFSDTCFKIGYNENDFKVYVEPFIGNKSLHTSRFTEAPLK